MAPTNLTLNLKAVKGVGLHYTLFRNRLPLFMRLPGSQTPKNCQISHRVAKVGLTMTAELLNEASLRFERYAQPEVRHA